MEHHSFNTDIACQYGIEEAILINNIAYWIKKNQANGKHFHDGHYWTYNSSSAFAELFPYINITKIKRVLTKLQKLGIVKAGNYNKIKIDRTKWYTIIDTSICSIYSLHCIKMNHPLYQNEPTIPDINTDVNTDNIYKENLSENNTLNNSSTKKKEKEISAKEKESTELENLRKFWNSKKIIECRKITPEIKKKWSKIIDEYSKHEIAKAIENYSTVINDYEYFFKHKWSLLNFLKNSKALPDFVEGGEKIENYRSQSINKSKQGNDNYNPYVNRF